MKRVTQLALGIAAFAALTLVLSVLLDTPTAPVSQSVQKTAVCYGCGRTREPMPTLTATATKTPTATPTKTATPAPTITPIYTPNSPNLGAYTETTVVLWPAQITTTTNLPFVVSVWLADTVGVEALEMAIVVNPVVVMPISVTLAESNTCDIFGVRYNRAVIFIECEGLNTTGRLFDLHLVGARQGYSIVDSAGAYATFAGIQNGWGFNVDVNGSRIWIVQ